MTRLLAAVLLAGAPAFALAADAAAPVSITVTMRDASAIEVAYHLPPACKALAFDNDGFRAQAAVHLRSDWKPLDDCTAVDFQSIRPTRAACTTLRLRIPATTRAEDTRVYGRVEPWAQPIGGGLYAHTSAYAVHGCGKADWRFEAPGGTVMVDGTVGADAVGRRGADVRAEGLAAVLLAQPYDAATPPFHADDRIPEATRTLLAQTTDASLGALHALLPGLRLAPAYVLALPDPAPGLRADVVNGTVLRLQVPEHEPDDLRAQARELLAHEIAHLAQPPRWPAPPGADAGAIREGGAEFLRLAMAQHLGWMGPEQLRDALEAAVNGCATAAGDLPWRALAQRGEGDLARRCGLALHALALAQPAHETPLRRLQALYGDGRTHDVTAIARTLECGTDAGCTPRLLARLRGFEPMRKVLDDEARRPGSLLAAAPAWGPALSATMALRHLDLLVRADCHGRAGVYPDPRTPRIEPGLRCGVLRAGMVPETAEGLPLFADGRAIAASRQACRTRGSTVLGLRGGGAVTIGCGKVAGMDEAVYGIDATRALELLR